MTPEQIKAELLRALNDEYGEEGWDDLRSLDRIVTRLVALLPEATETVEWGAKYADGRIVSCGWLEGISEGFAHRALSERPEMVLNRREAAVAVVSRVRSTTLHVTDWTEVDS